MTLGKKAVTYASVIGDLVASREHPDRPGLQRGLLRALEETNRRVEPVQPLGGTIGDEFQGLYADLRAALKATLLVRLLLQPHGDARFGIGLGGLRFEDPDTVPFGQDGPAWWGARDAVGLVAQAMAQRERPRGWRTAFVVHPTEHPDPSLEPSVNAFLLCRDELVGRMDGRDVRLLLAAFEGRSQEDVARTEGVSQSAVSQRNQRNGVYAIVTAHSTFEQGER